MSKDRKRTMTGPVYLSVGVLLATGIIAFLYLVDRQRELQEQITAINATLYSFSENTKTQLEENTTFIANIRSHAESKATKSE